LGVEKKGEELYQLTLGGNAGNETSIGTITGRGFAPDDITDAVETVVDTYLALRDGEGEAFIDTYARVGMAPFKAALYDTGEKAA